MASSTGFYKKLFVDGVEVSAPPTPPTPVVEQTILTAGYEGESFGVTGSSFNWQKIGEWVQFSGFVVYSTLPVTPGAVHLPLPTQLRALYGVPDNEIALVSLTSALPNLILRSDGVNNDGFILNSNGVVVNSSAMPPADTLTFSGKFRLF
jgi:hypothetical protein